MRYQVCIVRPEGYLHSEALVELAGLLHLGLRDLGHAGGVAFNRIEPGALNLVLGCHLLDPGVIPQMPTSTVIVNTEQVYADTTAWNARIFAWAARFQTWDYSERNLARLRSEGAPDARRLVIGYHPGLRRIPKPQVQDIDVLFYGSVNARRTKVLDALRRAGLSTSAVFGVYGEARDRLVARSKVVLNLHLYDSQIFEIVRVFDLMTNAKAVVGEVGEGTSIDRAYLAGIVGVGYENLVDACRALVSDDTRRIDLEQRALATLQRLPQAPLLEALLAPRGDHTRTETPPCFH